jgi:hypothetical protein
MRQMVEHGEKQPSAASVLEFVAAVYFSCGGPLGR